jgi:hypothetical protein
MSPRELIAEAWHITRNYRRILLPWGITDACVLLLAAIEFASYQGYVLYAYFRTGENPSFGSTLQLSMEFLNRHPVWAVSLLLTISIHFLLWLLIPRLATGALIGLAAKIRCRDEPRGGLVLGLYNFLPLLELAAALGLIGGKTLFTLWSAIIRYMEGDAALFVTTALLLVFWALSFIFHFFFTFAEEAIVIRKAGVFSALAQSFKLVLSYLSKVVLILLLLTVIILRIILNALVILFIPSLVLGLGLLLARFLPEGVSFGISGGLGLLSLLFASYFLGYITVFKHTVWTITYLELSKEPELDVIVKHAGASPRA